MKVLRLTFPVTGAALRKAADIFKLSLYLADGLFFRIFCRIISSVETFIIKSLISSSLAFYRGNDIADLTFAAVVFVLCLDLESVEFF